MSRDLIDRIALLGRSEAALSGLEDEMLAEKAASLGHHGRPVEKAMSGATRLRCRAGRCR